MREIKFRIYDKELKESHIEELQDLCEDDIWYDGETDVWNVLYYSTHEQERFVALQCTGIEDKNNIEIYEGDIVQVILPEFDKKWLGKIEYEQAICSYVIKRKGYIDVAFFENLKDIEVIGNIYDNPDLLKE